tara:strand:- start:2063 stop:2302 length:240 start_codon:yes stop_codon:yes gene_type:complete
MNKKRPHHKNDLKKFIKKHFGSSVDCAKALNVNPQTVYNWHTSNPRGMLKFAPEIVNLCNTTWTQLAGEVLHREEELNN